jgi:AcrR family transcriptional regulator
VRGLRRAGAAGLKWHQPLNRDSLLGVAYRRTPQIEARMRAQRETILAGAADLLADGGYASCSIAAVADRAHVATGTVYNHFANKADLAANLFRSLAERELVAVADAARSGRSAAERISAVIEVFAARAMKEPRRAFALLAEPADPAVDALRLEFRRSFRDVVAAAIADGVATGALPPQQAAPTAAALVGAIADALVGPLAGLDDAVDAVPALLAFAYRAIGAAPGGGRRADS